MKRRLTLVVISFLLVALLLAPTACVPKKATTPTPTATDQLQTRIASLEAKVASQADTIATLKSQLQALPAQQNWQPTTDQLRSGLSTLEKELSTAKNENANLKTQVADLTAKNTKLEARIVTLETVGGSETAGNGVTRWSFDIAFDEGYGNDITLDYNYKPARIEEEDTYSIRIDIMNAGSAAKAIKDAILTVMLTPQSKDTTVDTSNTFLDSASSPYLDWDSDFRPAPATNSKNSVACRRIEFTSEEFNLTIPAATTSDNVTVPGVYSLKLDFDLAYAK